MKNNIMDDDDDDGCGVCSCYYYCSVFYLFEVRCLALFLMMTTAET